MKHILHNQATRLVPKRKGASHRGNPVNLARPLLRSYAIVSSLFRRSWSLLVSSTSQLFIYPSFSSLNQRATKLIIFFRLGSTNIQIITVTSAFRIIKHLIVLMFQIHSEKWQQISSIGSARSALESLLSAEW